MESPVVTEIQAAPVRHVIDPKFCYPSSVNLLVKPENGSFKKPTPLNVVDARGNKHFMVVRGDSVLMSTDRLILDAGYAPIALLRHKKLSWDNVWKVYGGEKASKEAALFKVMRRKDALGLDVIMAAASDPKCKNEKMGEFRVGGRFLPTFYMNQSFVAYTVKKKISGKDGDAREVLVNAGIDCAFILALLVIHGEMWRWKIDEPKLAPPPRQVKAAVGGGRDRPNMAFVSAASSRPTELPAARPYKLPLPPPDKALIKDRRPSREKANDNFVGGVYGTASAADYSSSTGAGHGGHGGGGRSGGGCGGGGHGGHSGGGCGGGGHSGGGGGCGGAGGCGGGGCGGGGCGGGS